MNRSGILIAVLTILVISGCALPQWRVFQKKVDAKMTETPAEMLEAQRRGAKFIEQKSARVEPDPVEQISQIHSVASDLSASLGEPKKAVSVTDYERVIAELRAGKLAEQKKAEQLRAFIHKYNSKPLEDTGINLAGPAGLVALIGVIVACIACPAIGYIVLRVLPLLWGFFRRTTTAVAEFATENPDAGSQLKAKLSRRMDEAHKTLVRTRTKAPA